MWKCSQKHEHFQIFLYLRFFAFSQQLQKFFEVLFILRTPVPHRPFLIPLSWQPPLSAIHVATRVTGPSSAYGRNTASGILKHVINNKINGSVVFLRIVLSSSHQFLSAMHSVSSQKLPCGRFFGAHSKLLFGAVFQAAVFQAVLTANGSQTE